MSKNYFPRLRKQMTNPIMMPMAKAPMQDSQSRFLTVFVSTFVTTLEMVSVRSCTMVSLRMRTLLIYL